MNAPATKTSPPEAQESHLSHATGASAGEKLIAPEEDPVWSQLQLEARRTAEREPVLGSLLKVSVLNRPNLEEALAFRLPRKLGHHSVSAEYLQDLFREAFEAEPALGQQVRRDILAVKERDPACRGFLCPFLYFKGFQSLTAYRVAHFLWRHKRGELALYLQSLISEVFSVDIHPAARLGSGILFDHATSIVIGETALVDDDVSMLHEVTLGGTGKEKGDRHPKVRRGVLIGAGAKILGNVEIGECAKVGAGSVVLSDVAPHTTVAGVPAKIVGHTHEESPAHDMCHQVS